MSTRINPSDKLREKVLKEYNHLCAVCGGHSPQLHHIDGVNSNTVEENLLPLCHTHHLRDQHNPTRSIDVGIVKLFRQYRDPSILTPQFQPFYDRLKFLGEVESIAKVSMDDWQDNNAVEKLKNWRVKNEADFKDLIAFVSVMSHGGYYGNKIKEILTEAIPSKPREKHNILLRERMQSNQWLAKFDADIWFAQCLAEEVPEIMRLLIQMLKFQQWVPNMTLSERYARW